MKRSPAHEALDKVRALDSELGRLVHVADEDGARQLRLSSACSASSAEHCERWEANGVASHHFAGDSKGARS